MPGFANFAGELLVLFGSWKSATAGQWFVVAAAWGALIIGGVYMLRAIRAVLHGPLPESASQITDAVTAQRLPYVLLIGALLLFGIAPGLLTNQIKPAAARIVQIVGGARVNPPEAPAEAPQKVADLH